MAKIVELEGIGSVTFVKSTRARSIRLTVSDRGTRVTMPYWTPYLIAQQFVLRHASWIQRHQAKKPVTLIQPGEKVGKLHRVELVRIPSTETISSRVTATKIIVKHHSSEDITGPVVQQRAHKAVLRALKKEGQQLLPPRIQRHAQLHGLRYGTVEIKQLIRRWGSCDSKGNLTFNLYLMQLPWELIDYVIFHELTHLTHLNHSAAFWELLVSYEPRARDLRRQINTYRPIIQSEQ